MSALEVYLREEGLFEQMSRECEKAGLSLAEYVKRLLLEKPCSTVILEDDIIASLGLNDKDAMEKSSRKFAELMSDPAVRHTMLHSEDLGLWNMTSAEARELW